MKRKRKEKDLMRMIDRKGRECEKEGTRCRAREYEGAEKEHGGGGHITED